MCSQWPLHELHLASTRLEAFRTTLFMFFSWGNNKNINIVCMSSFMIKYLQYNVPSSLLCGAPGPLREGLGDFLAEPRKPRLEGATTGAAGTFFGIRHPLTATGFSHSASWLGFWTSGNTRSSWTLSFIETHGALTSLALDSWLFKPEVIDLDWEFALALYVLLWLLLVSICSSLTVPTALASKPLPVTLSESRQTEVINLKEAKKKKTFKVEIFILYVWFIWLCRFLLLASNTNFFLILKMRFWAKVYFSFSMKKTSADLMICCWGEEGSKIRLMGENTVIHCHYQVRQ